MNLTPVQKEIVSLIAEGWNNRRISYKLRKTETAIKDQVRIIFNKLGFSNRVELAVWQTKRDMSKGGDYL